jgi:hypothetical protein
VSSPSIATILHDHVSLSISCIDRLYLNGYVPQLQTPRGVACFFKFHRGYRFASSALMQKVTDAFLTRIEAFRTQQGVPLVHFEKGQRKDNVAAEHLTRFGRDEGVLFIGRAQERASVIRTERRYYRGRPYGWLVRSSAMVNQFYFYCVDCDFGPFFLKFCSYFPYNVKLCINGHEYVKRQLQKEHIRFQALDNGILSCADPKRLQTICDGLSAEKIDALFRKWLRLLPHPFASRDRAAGYRYQLSILQAEFSLTQVLDRPVTGRIFFEQVIRENLDIGRPGQVQLIFDRRILRTTPGRFRTRIITEGVIPSLHVDYKRSRIKQYFKEGRALRTETIINDAHDFEIGRLIRNLAALRTIGFQANRRLLDVERATHDCAIGEDAFYQLHRPLLRDGQKASALRSTEPRVQMLLSALLLFRLLPNGFSNNDLRQNLAPLLGLSPDQLSQGRMTYDLRRLRLHGLIHRIPRTHRYRVTDFGLRAALFFTRSHARILRPGLAQVLCEDAPPSRLRSCFRKLESAMDDWCEAAKLAA